MTPKRFLLGFLVIAGLLAAFLPGIFGRQSKHSDQLTYTKFSSAPGCLSEREVSATVQTLSSGTYAQQQRAITLLKDSANQSPTCRELVISVLVSALDQPKLDLTGGTPQFFLWHYGTQLLGELKAIEALDLLISRFDLHDGTPFPFNHRPAVSAVIDMGEIALPKLKITVRENPDRDTRQYAVFCIALIGGPVAEQILKETLTFESDACIVSCIHASLTAFKNKRRPHHISDEGRTKWYTTFLCNGQ